jgi:hypothetical protein
MPRLTRPQQGAQTDGIALHDVEARNVSRAASRGGPLILGTHHRPRRADQDDLCQPAA